MTVSIEPIGVIRSPYKEKFAVPRQPGLVEDGVGQLIFYPPYDQLDVVRGLTEFSHIWIIFLFHRHLGMTWKPTVRPPRLGGNKRLGVFATRSTFRPNAIGLSLIELKDIKRCSGQLILELGSLDIIDNTPVIDIKPYLPYADCQPTARAGFAQHAPETRIQVNFSTSAQQQLQEYALSYPNLQRFITQLLAQDPRPAYHIKQRSPVQYAVHLLDFNLCWQVENQHATVLSIDKV